MSKQGIVMRPGQASVSSLAPGRTIVLNRLSGATDGSVDLFEETIPARTKSTFERQGGPCPERRGHLYDLQ